jgi:hypothetical protein
MFHRRSSSELMLIGSVFEQVSATAAVLVGICQFFDDGGSLLFQLSETITGNHYALGSCLIAAGLCALGANVIESRTLRLLWTAMECLIWLTICAMYIIARSPRPVFGFALLMACLSWLAFWRLALGSWSLFGLHRHGEG